MQTWVVHGPDGDDGFSVFTREEWAAHGRRWPSRPTDSDIGLALAAGEVMASGEVVDVYGPLCRILAEAIAAGGGVAPEASDPRPKPTRRPPFVIGIAGGVAAGKSTTARVLQALLRRGEGRPRVDVLATDNFLYPNRELQERGLMDRKGFPESYDQSRLAAVLAAIRAGEPEVSTPVYSHESYDIVTGAQLIRRPEIVIVEGLNALQASAGAGPGDRVSNPDLFDVRIYVEAAEEDIALWFSTRLLALRTIGPAQPGPFSQWLASLSEEEVRSLAASTWSGINLVNLRENVAPTRGLADVVLEKGRDHHVSRVLVRRSWLPGRCGAW
ncbi:MAG TPA: type I pantothenate kinase [Acidimicrobiales bacterium]